MAAAQRGRRIGEPWRAALLGGLVAIRGTVVALLIAVAPPLALPAVAQDQPAAADEPTLPDPVRSFDRVSTEIEQHEGQVAQWWNGSYATGTWFGWRDKLSDVGVQVALTYTADILGNATGGINRKVRYFHNIGLDLLFDLEKLIHIPHADFHFAVSQRTGNSLSDEDIGNLFNVAEVCCQPITQVVTAAYEQQFLDQRLGIRLGHLSMGDDFATSPLYWQYVTSGIDGNPGALFYNVPFTAYPDATFGLRIRGKPLSWLTLQAGVYNGEVDNGAHAGNLRFNLSDGLMILSEVRAHHRLGGAAQALPGHAILGGYYHTGRFQRFDAPDDGLPSSAEYGNGGMYLHLDQMVWRFGSPADARGVEPFVVLVGAPVAAINYFPFSFNAGLVLRGPFAARPLDDILFGVVYGGVSGVKRDAERAAGEPPQDFEMVLEWSYILQLTPWLQLQPDIQYVIKPGATGDIPDALVLGAQIAINI